MLIAAWTVKAEKIYIYIRDEYPAALQILKNEIKELEKSGINKNIEIEIKRGAGSYVCGEESAMIESIEGKKGFPRHRPPYVADVGIFGKPTLVNNVETLYWIPMILKNGSEWFANKGINGSKGLRTYSVSGRVRNPGIKIVPAGVTANQLIDEYSGGILEDHEFTGYLPGGASGGILPSRLADIPLDFNNLSKYGCFVGSHAVVILSDADNIKDIAINLMDFFEHESCGQCTPCRVGTEKALNLMKKQVWDIELLNDLASVMSEASICGLGQAAPNPLLSIIKYFPELTNQ
jgi:NADH:ubiquinone oxidoreductase subunit F (NADH-binding)